MAGALFVTGILLFSGTMYLKRRGGGKGREGEEEGERGRGGEERRRRGGEGEEERSPLCNWHTTLLRDHVS